MRKYIVDLTNNLIGKNGYDNANLHRFLREGGTSLVEHVKNDLMCGDVCHMKPETLGKIMCSLESGDVMVGSEDLFQQIHFSGDCSDMLREIVSYCLARVIYDRLDPATCSAMRLPPYHHREPTTAV